MATLTARGRERRERLVVATASLVAQRGYHQVGVDEIGAAAGVSGAAIYRHFSGKQDLLVAVIERAVDALMSEATAAVDRARDADQALDGLIAAHVQFALKETALITVYDQEAHNLDEGPRRRLRRQQRAYTELWIDLLAQLAPARPREELALVVHGVFGLLNSVSDHHRRLSDELAAATLSSMARTSLDASIRGPRRPVSTAT
jgi:AcrR family transcriptional regulator